MTTIKKNKIIVMATLKDITGSKTLDKLDSQQIRELQTALRNNGYTIGVDGILGPETRRVFAQFKQDRWLEHPNLIGQSTVKALYQPKGNKDSFEDEPLLQVNTVLPTPFIQQPIIWTDFSSPVSQYFTVGEVSRYSAERLVFDHNHRRNVERLAFELDKIRKEWGSAIAVTSWYRPPAVNSRVGGVSNSQHLNGGAVDIFPVNGKKIEFERFLDTHWFGRLGWGQKNRRGFTHLDMANGKGWRSGGVKGTRWDY